MMSASDVFGYSGYRAMRTAVLLLASAVIISSVGTEGNIIHKVEDVRGRGSGDILMTAFDGTSFWFNGVPGNYYNLVSEPDVFQVSTRLKEANNPKRTGSHANGTYMQAIAFQQLDGQVVVEMSAHDSAKVKVSLNHERLAMDNGVGLHHEVILKDGSRMVLSSTVVQPSQGAIITITTDSITLDLYAVPPGRDKKNVWEPSYLNLNFTLAKAPKGALQGVIGDTFNSIIAKEAGVDGSSTAKTPEDTAEPLYPVFADTHYEIGGFFNAPRTIAPKHIINAVIALRRTAPLRAALAGANPIPTINQQATNSAQKAFDLPMFYKRRRDLLEMHNKGMTGAGRSFIYFRPELVVA